MNKTNDYKFNLPAYSDPVDIEDLNDNFRGIDDALMAGLCKKDYTGNNMGSSDPSARKYAWAPWFEIVNDNEFDVVVTDRNAPVESEEATINIAAGQTFRKYINGRYYMNFYVQDQYDVTFKWFTNAETYINESGGGGGGTGTVTSVSVQGGSGSHLTGSGNPIETSGTIIINVDDGYSIPSDNEQDAWDGKAADLKAEIDSSTYVLTLQLKDSAGNLIGTAKTIDLPLETMVVDGEYDPQTKKIKLELKNGNYVEFSVADLVSGLQTELSASNKLDPAYIDYDSSHRAVSDTEKTTWNGKQNAISDLETIRSGAAAGATAVQPSAMQTALSTKQDSLDNTQLAAVNSGINSTKVTQIETNKTNILYAIDNGGKNKFNCDPIVLQPMNTVGTWSGNAYTVSSKTFTINNGEVTVSGGLDQYNTARMVIFKGDIPAGTKITGCPAGGATSGIDSYCIGVYDSNDYFVTADIGNGVSIPNDLTNVTVCVTRARGAISSSLVFKPMLCTVDAWNISHEFVPCSLPNYDLTRLEAEDRAGLVECVDGGAKNLLDISKATFGDRSKITFNSDGSVTGNITDDARYWNWENSEFKFTLQAGTYVLYCKSTTGSNINWGVALRNSTNTIAVAVNQYTGKDFVEFTLSSATELGFMGKIFDRRLYTMLCTKAAFGVSNKFVPYRPNYDLVVQGRIAPTTSGTIMSGNLNDFPTSYYLCSGAVANLPEYTGYAIVKTIVIDVNAALQEAFTLNSSGNKSYMRTKWNGTWNPWVLNTNASS